MKISNIGLKKYKNYNLFDFKSIFHFFLYLLFPFTFSPYFLSLTYFLKFSSNQRITLTYNDSIFKIK